MRVAIYLRMSTDRQDTSIADQRKACRDHAEAKGYTIVAEYVDEGISGDATEKRKAFQRLIADAAAKKFRLIVCWDQDRFGRFDPIEGGFWIKPIRDAGVQLETITQGRIDWSDFSSRLIWTVTQEAKHAYLRDMAKNVTRGLRSAVESGVYPGSAPFGYRKENMRLVLGPPEEVETVRRIFLLKSQGLGYRSISQRLVANHVPCPGKEWTANNVRYIIDRRAYTGVTIYGKKLQGKYSNIGKVIEIPDTHPAIVTPAEFAAAHATKRNNTVHARNGEVVARLAGLLTCGLCGSPMYHFKYKQQYGYVCGKYHQSQGCGFCRIMEPDISNLIAERLAVTDGKDGPIAQAIRRAMETPESTKDRSSLDSKVRRLRGQIERAAGRLLQVDDSLFPELAKRVSAMQAELKAAERELSALGGQQKQGKPSRRRELSLPEAFAHASPAAVRQAVRSAVESITIQFEQESRACTRRFFRFTGLDIALK